MTDIAESEIAPSVLTASSIALTIGDLNVRLAQEKARRQSLFWYSEFWDHNILNPINNWALTIIGLMSTALSPLRTEFKSIKPLIYRSDFSGVVENLETNLKASENAISIDGEEHWGVTHYQVLKDLNALFDNAEDMLGCEEAQDIAAYLRKIRQNYDEAQANLDQANEYFQRSSQSLLKYDNQRATGLSRRIGNLREQLSPLPEMIAEVEQKAATHASYHVNIAHKTATEALRTITGFVGELSDFDQARSGFSADIHESTQKLDAGSMHPDELQHIKVEIADAAKELDRINNAMIIAQEGHEAARILCSSDEMDAIEARQSFIASHSMKIAGDVAKLKRAVLRAEEYNQAACIVGKILSSDPEANYTINQLVSKLSSHVRGFPKESSLMGADLDYAKKARRLVQRMVDEGHLMQIQDGSCRFAFDVGQNDEVTTVSQKIWAKTHSARVRESAIMTCTKHFNAVAEYLSHDMKAGQKLTRKQIAKALREVVPAFKVSAKFDLNERKAMAQKLSFATTDIAQRLDATGITQLKTGVGRIVQKPYKRPQR